MNRMPLPRACPWAKYRRIILIIRAFKKSTAVSSELLGGFALKDSGLLLGISDLGLPSEAYGEK